jgi:GntR family transcriptional regulator
MSPPPPDLSRRRLHAGTRAGGFVPLHERLRRELSERVLLGSWPPGSAVPGEVELAAEFDVAVGTVRRALSALVAEGMLARRPRVGTVVTGRTPEHSLRFFFRYFRLHGADGSLQHSLAVPQALWRAPATTGEAPRLGVAPGAALVHIRRVRQVAERPVMLDHYRIPQALVPGFPEDAAAVPELLFLHLLERWGLRVTAVREELRADLATADDAAALGLILPAALLVIEETGFDPAARPLLLGTHRASTEAHHYINEVR